MNLPTWLTSIRPFGTAPQGQSVTTPGRGGGYGAAQQPLMQYGNTPPLFGRPGWTYVRVQEAPRQGPLPMLAQGSGRTGGRDNRVSGTLAPGYLAQNDYKPDPMDYSPPTNESFTKLVPKSVGIGNDGLSALNPTYRAHDFTMATYVQNQWRSSANWQQMAFPPTARALLTAQQVAKYNLYNSVSSARILSQNNYFLGYQINPTQAAQYGGSGLGMPLGA